MLSNLACHSADSALLIILRPFNDGQVTVNEALAVFKSELHARTNALLGKSGVDGRRERPADAFSNRQGLSNLAAYTALSLPLLLGPQAYIGDILTLLIATIGVAISAVTSAFENAVVIVSNLFAGLQGVWALILGIAGFGGEIVSEAVGVVAEGVQVSLLD